MDSITIRLGPYRMIFILQLRDGIKCMDIKNLLEERLWLQAHRVVTLTQGEYVTIEVTLRDVLNRRENSAVFLQGVTSLGTQDINDRVITAVRTCSCYSFLSWCMVLRPTVHGQVMANPLLSSSMLTTPVMAATISQTVKYICCCDISLMFEALSCRMLHAQYCCMDWLRNKML